MNDAECLELCGATLAYAVDWEAGGSGGALG